MKLKGIHPAEQHFDKILVGVLGLAALGIVAYQFLIPVNNVKVGAGAPVPPHQAFVPVEREAATLAQRLETRQPQLPEKAPPGLGDSLTAVLNPVTINPGTGLPLGPQLALGGISASSGVIANSSYAAPVPPAPQSVATASFRTAIDPQEVVRTPGLAELVPQQQPFDKAAVSIEAFFDGAMFATMLQNDPDGDGPMQPMPLSWWRDPQTQGRYLVDIVAVEVQRETLRTADGVTPPGDTVSMVQTLPGRFDGRAYWSERVRSLGDVSMELTALEARAEEIRRPAYYASIAGFPWEPPSEVVPPEERGDRAREVERARRQLNDLDNRLERMREQLGNAGNRPPRDDPSGARPPGGRSPGTGAAPGGRRTPGGGGGGRTPPPPRDSTPEPSVNPDVLQRQIERLEGERAKLIERLRALGEVVDGDTGVAAGGNQVTPTISVLDDEQVRVWAHDIRVEPGAQYRYRVRVVMNNPLFGRGLKEEQSSLAEQKLIESDWSEWSAPVEVDRDRYFFVTSAEDRSQVTGRPRASAELIVFYYGYYRSASVGLEPGDAITATVRLPANLKLADMDKLREQHKDQPAGDPSAPPAAPTPPAPGRGPAGRTPGGMSPGMSPPGVGPGAAPSPRDERPASAPVDAAASAAWMTIDAEDRVELSEDAVLLDVGRVAAAAPVTGGGNAVRFKAILRRASGDLDVRIPEEDRASALYKRLNSSVRAGVAATAPAPAPLPDRPAAPVPAPAPRDPEPPRRNPGGGGGGGGGG